MSEYEEARLARSQTRDAARDARKFDLRARQLLRVAGYRADESVLRYAAAEMSEIAEDDRDSVVARAVALQQDETITGRRLGAQEIAQMHDTLTPPHEIIDADPIRDRASFTSSEQAADVLELTDEAVVDTEQPETAAVEPEARRRATPLTYARRDEIREWIREQRAENPRLSKDRARTMAEEHFDVVLSVTSFGPSIWKKSKPEPKSRAAAAATEEQDEAEEQEYEEVVTEAPATLRVDTLEDGTFRLQVDYTGDAHTVFGAVAVVSELFSGGSVSAVSHE